ncbi:universal stress protein [Streptomyces sp. bgisy031]|uniref:universal stress protein n=1 Tax=Streptomyces sp. bgisy031 TaxID=3413772 RepID=UPI003D726C0A
MSTPRPLPVVAAVDGSEDSLRALEWALTEAGRRGAPVRIAHVRQNGPWTRHGAPASGSPEPAGDAVLDEVRATLTGRGGLPPVAYVTLEGAPATVLAELGSEAQLLVLGSRGRGGFASLLLGSNGVAAARDAACPVVVVPRPGRAVHGDSDAPPGPRVVVGVDVDEPDDSLLAFAFEEAHRGGARLQVIAAFPWPVLAWTTFGDFTPTTVDQEAAESETLTLLNAAVAPFRKAHTDVEVDLYVAPGDAAGHLVENSREADLVVVGRHRRRLTRPAPMLGTVTMAVLLHAASPVAVVPPAPEDMP